VIRQELGQTVTTKDRHLYSLSQSSVTRNMSTGLTVKMPKGDISFNQEIEKAVASSQQEAASSYIE